MTEAGLPCVTFNSGLPESGRLAFVGQNIHRAGYVAAETFNDYKTSFAVVRNAIACHLELRGVYMANLNVVGCVEAIRAAGKTGEIRVICHDINESVRQMLLNGSTDFTIPQDLVRQGYASLMMLRDYLYKRTLQETLGMGEKSTYFAPKICQQSWKCEQSTTRKYPQAPELALLTCKERYCIER